MTTRKDAQGIADRVRGTLLGLAAGDRNGGPIRMAMRLAESLAERQRFDADDVFERYKDWMRSGAFDTGPVTGGVLRLALEEGRSSRDAASRVHRDLGGYTAGCNSAHRIPPLAMSAEVADGDLDACAREEAALTHRHPLAADASAAVAVLCRALIHGEPLTAARDHAGRGRRDEIAAAVTEDSDVETLSGGGFSPETLRAAMYFVARHDSFGEALSESLRFAGPANYCPVLVGAIAGARWGVSSIAESDLSHCNIGVNLEENLRDRVEVAADALAATWDDEHHTRNRVDVG